MPRSRSWKGPAQEARGLGAIEPADWEKSIAYLGTLGLVPNPVTVEDVAARPACCRRQD